MSSNLQNLLLNGNFEYWYAGTTVAPDGWVISGAAGTVVQESGAGNFKYGSYSAKITRNGTNVQISNSFFVSPAWLQLLKGKTITFSCFVKCSTANSARLKIVDTVGNNASSYHTGGGDWELLTVAYTVDLNPGQILIFCQIMDNDVSAYFDGAMLNEGKGAFAYTPHPEDHLYEQTEHPIPPTVVVNSSDDANFNGKLAAWGSAYADQLGQHVLFPVDFPQTLFGHPVVIDSCIIGYNTIANGDYITQVTLVARTVDDFAATYPIQHLDDLGHGTSGTEAHDIVDTPVELTSGKSLHFLCQVAGNDAAKDITFHGFTFLYHVKVHG